MTKTIAYIQQSGTECPSCGTRTTDYIYHLKAGTTFTRFREWSPSQRQEHSLSIEEHCTRCGFSSQVK